MKALATLALLLTLLPGCATQGTLTVRSQPPGAYVTEPRSGGVLGVAPVTVYYQSAALEKWREAQDWYQIQALQATRVSGAVSRSPAPLRLCGDPTGQYTITLNRSSSAPGLDKDLQFASQMESIAAQKRQAKAAKDAALVNRWLGMQVQAKKPVRSSTTTLGDSLQTVCR